MELRRNERDARAEKAASSEWKEGNVRFCQQAQAREPQQ